jgi:hypothetical protein
MCQSFVESFKHAIKFNISRYVSCSVGPHELPRHPSASQSYHSLKIERQSLRLSKGCQCKCLLYDYPFTTLGLAHDYPITTLALSHDYRRFMVIKQIKFFRQSCSGKDASPSVTFRKLYLNACTK